MKIAIGCDEAAYSLKKIIIDHLSNRDDIELKDFGAEAEGSYPMHYAFQNQRFVYQNQESVEDLEQNRVLSPKYIQHLSHG